MAYFALNDRRRLYLLAVLMLTLVVSSHRAIAGPLPMPLEVHLDQAKSVVVGEMKVSADPGMQGSATITVSEVLKGTPAKTIKVSCATQADPGYQGAEIIHVYSNGDSGIWVINADSSLADYYGLLPLKRKSDVIQILQQLAERRWSAPVNGLQAWAAVVKPEYHTNPVIIFAVQNSSQADIYIPTENSASFISATATTGEKQYDYKLSQGPVRDTIYCRKLAPGEIAYLHPLYSFIDLKWHNHLPDGKYTVVITCQNAREKGIPARSADMKDTVTAWTGKLSAPPVELITAPQMSN